MGGMSKASLKESNPITISIRYVDFRITVNYKRTRWINLLLFN